tara:strand:+ start:311 stop:1309 length:999 start_codon:yes stop_codon:yes gene_type:complete
MIESIADSTNSPGTVLSVIIPNYNGQIFVEPCLNSIIPQLTDSCELIFVDDGSEDGSLEIVQAIFNKFSHKNLRLFCQENGGPGSARNLGILKSTGRYCAFMDSDDIVTSGYIAFILEKIEMHAPDAIQFNLIRIEKSNSSQNKVECHSIDAGFYQMSEVRSDIFGKGKWFAWSRVFNKEIILKNLFPNKKVFYEDVATMPRALLCCDNIYLSNDAYYVYRSNECGVTNNHKESHAFDLLSSFENYRSIEPIECRDIIRVQIARAIVFFKLELGIKNIPVRQIFQEVKDISNRKNVFRYLSFPDKLFLASPELYFILDALRKKPFVSAIKRK